MSNDVKLRLPDGSVQAHPAGITPLEVARGISRGLAGAAVGALVDDEYWDLERELPTGEHTFKLVKFEDPRGGEFYWHTAAHVLATAVQRLFPGVRFGIGPAIDQGYYYDFLVEKPFTDEDLAAIEDEMRRVIDEDLPLVREVVDRQAARTEMLERGEELKVELIDELPEDAVVSFYRDGEFVDLCRGPHLPSTGRLGVVKLLSVAGAYWRGDEQRPMLSRIYGTAFPKQKQLDEYLERIAEAKRRDHRKLGKELELFSVAEDYGPGMVLYHPAGAVLFHEIEQLAHRMYRERGYRMVRTPHVFRTDLWRISGHYEHYREKMFFARLEGDDADYAVKPMNCPGHVLIYDSGLHSYRELPYRIYEFGNVYRNELSGVLHGMLRVRGFTIDDAHIFCTPEQLGAEIEGVLGFVRDIFAVFGLSIRYTLSTRPADSMGSEEIWELATTALRGALEHLGLDYDVDEGGGAFYGPKIDVHVTDALGREWQTSTCQADFNLPERFDLNYIGEDGERHRVVLVHRAILGSFERFIGVLIEHFAGVFPLWLSPEQVRILPVAESFNDYGAAVVDDLTRADLRAELDDSDRKLGAKIANAETAKVPYIGVVGGREAEAGSVQLRGHGGRQFGVVSRDELREKLLLEYRERRLESVFSTE